MKASIPFSEACERNKSAIFSVIEAHLDQAQTVLEIGSGTAQHAVYFSQQKPHVVWQTSDRAEYLAGIHAQLAFASVANVKAPVLLDVNQAEWFQTPREFDLVYTANTFHIMSEGDIRAFFAGLVNVLARSGGTLIVYGPFKYQKKFTSDSNAVFDQSLRARGVGSAIRDIEWIQQLALEQNLALHEDHSMPANNQCLVFKPVTI